MYAELRTNLLDRLLDKEPLVRAHCVTVLSKLAASEEPDDLEDDQQPIVTSLLNSLFYDPASFVYLFCSNLSLSVLTRDI